MCNWYYVLIGAGVMAIAHFVEFCIYCKKNGDYNEFILSGVVVWVVLTLVMGIAFICASFTIKEEYHKQQLKREYVMNVVETMDSYDYANFGITETILNYNQWLEEAKAKKATFGNWSFYKNVPVEELEFIGMEKEKSNES